MSDTSPTDDDPRSAILSAAWLLVPLTILIGDLQIRWVREFGNVVTAFGGWFALSMTMSVLGWWSLVTLFRGTRARWIAIPLGTALIGAMVFITWESMRSRFFAISPNEVLYLFEEPKNAAQLVMGGWSLGVGAVFVGAVALWSGFLLLSAATPVRRWMRALAAACLVAEVVIVTFLFPSIFVMPWTPYPSDVRSAYVLTHGIDMWLEGRGSFRTGYAERRDVGEVEQTDRPSVLIVVGESMRLGRMSAFSDTTRDTTPHLREFLETHPDEAFSFQRHVPSSAATFWAVSGLFTGHYPTTTRADYRTLPALWQYAEAANFDTFLVTSQSWSWMSLRDFWLHPSPDRFADADDLGIPIVNDTGGDDVPVAQIVSDWLDKDEVEAPFLGIVQFNATHWPFVEHDEAEWPTDTEVGAFDAATMRTDEATAILLDALERDALLEDTIVIFTSDHAEVLGVNVDEEDQTAIRSREPSLMVGARVASCEPVYANAPLMVYVPRKWQERLGLDPARLRSNTARVTSHVDLAPTVLSLWSLEPTTPMDGRSLLKPIDDDRTAYCFTSPSWAIHEISGLGARRGDLYVYTRRNLSRVYEWELPAGTRRRALHFEPLSPGAQSLLDQMRNDPELSKYLRPIEQP